MGKWAKYRKKYNKNWETESEFKTWLTEGTEDDAFCKICCVNLRPHKADLSKHGKTQMHRNKASSLDRRVQPAISVVRTSVSDVEKERDILLSLFIANHSSIRSIDHLGEMLSKVGKGSSLEEVRLHRTKCSSIILNVVAPCLREQLRDEIGNNSYSIILDESTEITGNDKFMAYCIRYYNVKFNRVVVDFLGLQKVFRATAEVLYENFLQFIDKVGLDLNKLTAIATDGASNLCGCNNSLYTLLKQRLPRLHLFKCVCHSLNLCAQKAAQELPSNLEFQLRETRNWFSHSVLRKQVYETVYKSLNAGKRPPKLVQLCNTRWLAFHGAIKSTLDQWESLKRHFLQISQSRDKNENNCFTARTLANMYLDNSNFLYFTFLDSVLKEVNDINLSFQANDANIIQLFAELRSLLVSCAKRVFKPVFLRTEQNNPNTADIINVIKKAIDSANKEFGSSLLDIDDCDFGIQFKDFLSNQKHGILKDDLKMLKMRCRSFLLKLCTELLDRFPQNVAVIDKLRYFTPEVFLKKKDLTPDDLPWELIEKQESRLAVELQFRKLRSVQSEDISHDPDDFEDPVKFWGIVSRMKTAVGNPAFSELSAFALRALTLPISNATVERVFSVLNTTKTKLRNKLGFSMTDSLLVIKNYGGVRKLCCLNFPVSKAMIARHNKNMYLREEDEEVNELQLLAEIEELIENGEDEADEI